jgi:hypothetical protein
MGKERPLRLGERYNSLGECYLVADVDAVINSRSGRGDLNDRLTPEAINMRIDARKVACRGPWRWLSRPFRRRMVEIIELPVEPFEVEII